MKKPTFQFLKSMVSRGGADGGGRGVDYEARKNWLYYKGDHWSNSARARFAELGLDPTGFNISAAQIDSYLAGADPQDLEPYVFAEENQLSYLADLASAAITKTRRLSGALKIEKRQLLDLLIMGIAGVFSEVVSVNGRKRHRIARLKPGEFFWDYLAQEPNFSDSVWRARSTAYTVDELKLEMPQFYQTLRKKFGKDLKGVPRQTVLFSERPSRLITSATYVEVSTIEWRELQSYLLIPADALEDADRQAAEEHSFDITVDGMKLAGDEVDTYLDWMDNYALDPRLSDRSEQRQGEVVKYATLVGDEVMEWGALPEGKFRIVITTGPIITEPDDNIALRSLIGDIRPAQDIANQAVALWLTLLAKMAKNTWFIPASENRQEELERKVSAVGSVIVLDDPNAVRNVGPDSNATMPAENLVQLAQKMIDTRLGTTDYSRGGTGSSGSANRLSSKTLGELLSRSDAAIKLYYEQYLYARIELAELMLAQLRYWTLDELGRLTSPELTEPVRQMLASTGVQEPIHFPAAVMWDVSVDLRQPSQLQEVETTAMVVNQGLLPQMAQLNILPPSEVLMKMLLPLFSNLTEGDKDAWRAKLAQDAIMAQQAQLAGQLPPEGEAPPDEGGAPQQ